MVLRSSFSFVLSVLLSDFRFVILVFYFLFSPSGAFLVFFFNFFLILFVLLILFFSFLSTIHISIKTFHYPLFILFYFLSSSLISSSLYFNQKFSFSSFYSLPLLFLFLILFLQQCSNF